MVEQLFRTGGETVHVCAKHPNGISEKEYAELLRVNPKAGRWGWRVMRRNSLRNLANAARVLEGNPALMNLRLIQSLTAAQNTGNTLVVGMPGGFVPLKNGKSGAHGSTTHEDGAS